MSMLKELWLCGLDYQGRPVKKGSAMERKLCLYAKNGEKLQAMLTEQQAEQYEKTIDAFNEATAQSELKAFEFGFHDLRHTFATMALEHGMDVKTLSAVVGHISSATTIDVYSHVTGAMQMQAAQKIERGIGHSEAYTPHATLADQLPAEVGKEPVSPPFAPYKGKIRKPGTGGIYELGDHLFEGRYTPTNAQGKREVHTVYAKTKEEVIPLLEQMIQEVRERINAEKTALKAAQTRGIESK